MFLFVAIEFMMIHMFENEPFCIFVIFFTYYSLQCETMGLQATSPPTSPLHRPPVASVPVTTASMLKRKHDMVSEDEEDLEDNNSVLMHAMTTGSGVKKICVEVVCADPRNVSVSAVSRHSRSASDEDIDLSDLSDEDTNSSSSGSHLDDESMMSTVSSSNTSGDEENKENQINLNKLNKGELDSILAKTLLNSPASSSASIVSRYVYL